MTRKPILSYKFFNVPVEKQKIIKEIVEKNIDWKIDSYLKKIYGKKDDIEVRIDYKFLQNKQKKYECSFIFIFDGKNFTYNSKTPFKYPEDLVNHAFRHFKEFVSKYEDKKVNK